MKNNDCLFSDIQNLCNAVSDWLIKKSIIQLNPTRQYPVPVVTSCVITAEPVKNRLLILCYLTQNNSFISKILSRHKNYLPRNHTLALIWHSFIQNRVCISEVIRHHTFAQPIPVQAVYWKRCVNTPCV